MVLCGFLALLLALVSQRVGATGNQSIDQNQSSLIQQIDSEARLHTLNTSAPHNDDWPRMSAFIRSRLTDPSDSLVNAHDTADTDMSAMLSKRPDKTAFNHRTRGGRQYPKKLMNLDPNLLPLHGDTPGLSLPESDPASPSNDALPAARYTAANPAIPTTEPILSQVSQSMTAHQKEARRHLRTNTRRTLRRHQEKIVKGSGDRLFPGQRQRPRFESEERETARQARASSSMLGYHREYYDFLTAQFPELFEQYVVQRHLHAYRKLLLGERRPAPRFETFLREHFRDLKKEGVVKQAPFNFRAWLRMAHPDDVVRLSIGERLNTIKRRGTGDLRRALRDARAVQAQYGGKIPLLDWIKEQIGEHDFNDIMNEPIPPLFRPSIRKPPPEEAMMAPQSPSEFQIPHPTFRRPETAVYAGAAAHAFDSDPELAKTYASVVDDGELSQVSPVHNRFVGVSSPPNDWEDHWVSIYSNAHDGPILP